MPHNKLPRWFPIIERVFWIIAAIALLYLAALVGNVVLNGGPL